MSTKFPGGFLTKDYVAPTPSSAKGIWTLDQQMQAQKTGTWPFGGPFNYIEDVFSTYLYQGASSSPPTIVNGIDLAGKGGMVWIKARNGATNQTVTDTIRGPGKEIYTNQNWDQQNYTGTYGINSFNANGFSLVGNSADTNTTAYNYASWTFRKQPKFFDIVTYTGDGISGRTVPHNLTVAPGFVIVKRTDASAGWACKERIATGYNLLLNSTVAGNDATTTDNGFIGACTSTTIALTTGSTDANNVNASGGTYVAYLFAHNAGGFGATATDNVISCGSFTTDASGNATVTLGYEPQFIIRKRTDSTSNWDVADIMRRMDNTDFYRLRANLPNAEDTANGGPLLIPTATGFTAQTLGNTATHIYIAIRRGPMKVPTLGTSVFSPFVGSDASTITTGFPVDMLFDNKRAGNSNNTVNASRLVGENSLTTSSTAAETAGLVGANCFQNNTGYLPNALGTGIVAYAYQRAPSFFDVVCFTQTISSGTQTINHNLGAVPQLIIIKTRSVADNWKVGSNLVSGFTNLNSDYAFSSPNLIDTFSDTTFGFRTGSHGYSIGTNYVSYLFATCAGVSKVGSYTGTGAAQTINCGFTAGSRFVLIKRTDSSGDWYFWDSARGIIPSNDPYLLLNSATVEVTGTDYVDTTNVGFDITSTAPAAINANGGTFIFLAIA